MTTSLPAWHPSVFARRRPNLEIRRRVLAALRDCFAQENFAEVETPILQTMPGGEVHVQAFATDLRGPTGTRRLFLHTSPEFAMKKLLVAGLPRLYQFAHVFRNGERSSLHHPEFLMLEWYRSEAGDSDLIGAIQKDCIVLIRAAAKAAGCRSFRINGVTCDPFGEWENLSVADAFYRYAGIDLLATAPDSQKPDRDLLALEAQRIGVHVSDGDGWDDLFFRIMGEKIEPLLGKERPTFLYDYPISMAALARPKKDARLVERFELYIGGIELANAFGELTDAGEQQRRLQADMDQKKQLYGETWPLDEDFIEALRFGMPESAGIALGVDRLVMLCAGAKSIDDVLWLPVSG